MKFILVLSLKILIYTTHAAPQWDDLQFADYGGFMSEPIEPETYTYEEMSDPVENYLSLLSHLTDFDSPVEDGLTMDFRGNKALKKARKKSKKQNNGNNDLISSLVDNEDDSRLDFAQHLSDNPDYESDLAGRPGLASNFLGDDFESGDYSDDYDYTYPIIDQDIIKEIENKFPQNATDTDILKSTGGGPLQHAKPGTLTCDGTVLIADKDWYVTSKRFAEVFLENKPYFLKLAPILADYEDAERYCSNLGAKHGKRYGARMYCPKHAREHSYLMLLFGKYIYSMYNSTSYYDHQRGFKDNSVAIDVPNGYSEGWTAVSFNDQTSKNFDDVICSPNNENFLVDDAVQWGVEPFDQSPGRKSSRQPEDYNGTKQTRRVNFRIKPLTATQYAGVYMDNKWGWNWYPENDPTQRPFFCQLDCSEAPAPEILFQSKNNILSAVTLLKRYLTNSDLSDVTGHGCWCAKLDYLAAFNYVGGPFTVDNLDRICKEWMAVRTCTKLSGGSCHEHGFQEYQIVMNGIQSDIDLNDCGGNNQVGDGSCAYDSCKIDKYYANLIREYLRDNKEWEPLAGSNEACPMPEFNPYRKSDRSLDPSKFHKICEGTVPFLTIRRVLIDEEFN